MSNARNTIAARLSWRELRRHPWRSFLIVALIGLPVLVMTLQTIVTASTAYTEQGEIEHQLMGADGVLQVDSAYATSPSTPYSEGSGIEVPHPYLSFNAMYYRDRAELDDPYHGGFEGAAAWWDEVSERAENYPRPADVTPEGLAAALPDGVTLHPVREGSHDFTLDNGMTLSASVVIADFTDPVLAERFRSIDGAVPTDQVVTVSRGYDAEFERLTHNAAALGKDEPVALLFQGEELLMSGNTVDQQTSSGLVGSFYGWPWGEDGSFPTVFVDAGSQLAEDLTAEAGTLGYGVTSYYLSGPVPTDYAAYLPFAQAKAAVVFRPVAEDPPTEAMELQGSYFDSSDRYFWILFLGTLALVETGLLAGAAFAVGARSQQRTTAMLSAVGASPTTLRRTMGLSGLWCGLAGAVGGALLGVGIAYALWAVASAQLLVFNPLVIPWWVIAVTVVVGVGVSIAAAWIPARSIAEQDAWAAIKGGVRERRGVSSTLRWAGVSLVVVGLVVLVTSTIAGMSIDTARILEIWTPVLSLTVFLAGILVIVGTLLLIPTVLNGLARVSGRLPWTLRIAARDADRNRSRTVPVTVAMVAAACLGAASLTGVGMSFSAYQQMNRSDVVQPSGAGLGVVPVSTLVEQELTEEYDRAAGIDTDAPEYENYLAVYTQSEAREKVATAAPIAGLRVDHSWTYSRVMQDCVSFGNAQCDEIYPLVSEDSVCHIPVPKGASLEERHEEIYTVQGERTRSEATECFGYAPGNSFSGFYSDTSALIAVTKLDEPSPTVLWGDDADVTAAYERGSAVVLDPTLLNDDGTVTLGRFNTDLRQASGLTLTEDDINLYGVPEPAMTLGDDDAIPMSPRATDDGTMLWEPEESRRVPAVLAAAPEVLSDVAIVLPEDLLDWAEPQLNPNGLVVRFDQTPSDKQWELLSLALEQDQLWINSGDTGTGRIQWSLWFVTGMIALLVLTAAGILAGLAMADSRRDHRALDSIGAAPSARKAMAAAQMLTSMVVSLVLGTLAGVLPFAAVQLIMDLRLSWIPWWQLLALTVALPVVAAGVTWLVTPARFSGR